MRVAQLAAKVETAEKREDLAERPPRCEDGARDRSGPVRSARARARSPPQWAGESRKMRLTCFGGLRAGRLRVCLLRGRGRLFHGFDGRGKLPHDGGRRLVGAQAKKAGCRIRPSSVTSLKATSATRRGLTQCGRPTPTGRVAKGHVSCSRDARRCLRSRRVLSEKPVRSCRHRRDGHLHGRRRGARPG